MKMYDTIKIINDRAIYSGKTGDTPSAVRITPYATHGWRPTSVTNHPASTATNPIGVMNMARYWKQRESYKRLRQNKNTPRKPVSIISIPMPTIMRNDQNTMATGGRSSGAHPFRPLISPALSWVRMNAAPFGMASLYFV